jgi:hypothetical protein
MPAVRIGEHSRGPFDFAQGRLLDSGVRPFDFAQGRLSLRMTGVCCWFVI